MDLARLKEYLELMNRHQLEELEVEENGFRVRLKKKGETIKEMRTVPAGNPAAALSVGASGAPAEPAAGVDEANLIKAPMVGTFYRSANPDADPFVEEGDRIDEGKVLCIIEAMKVMNEVKAERSGTVEEIYLPNGDPVEYGQPLFRIS